MIPGGMDPASIDELLEKSRSLISSLSTTIFRARNLRERSQQIREENADYREFLLEQRLDVLCRHEDRRKHRTP